jgi:type IV pilus assembly protein PilF
MRNLVVPMLVVLALAGCAQDTQITSTSASEVRSAPEPADAERRARTRLELASLYFGRAQYEVALQEIGLALAARPDMGTAYNLRGLVYSAMGDDALADESFLRALALNPRDADAMHNRAGSSASATAARKPTACSTRRWPSRSTATSRAR